MASKYLVDKSFIDKAKREHKKSNTITNTLGPTRMGRRGEGRFHVRITGKALPTAGYESECIYKGVQVISDSYGEYQDLTQIWGDGASGSYTPIIDITSLGPYHIADTELKRIPDNTIVEVFTRGDVEGKTEWYCEPPEQTKPISFGAEILDSSGTEKVRIAPGVIYGRGFSTQTSETEFNTSDGLHIYAQYTIDMESYIVTVVGVFSQSGRPTEIVDAVTTRTVKIPLVHFNTVGVNLIMTRDWEGDIDTGSMLAHLWMDSGSCEDLTYSGEHQELPITGDTGWEIIDQSNNGICLTVCTGVSYYHTGDKTIYQYSRDFTFNGEGKLVEVSAETRTTVDVAEPCI